MGCWILMFYNAPMTPSHRHSISVQIAIDTRSPFITYQYQQTIAFLFGHHRCETIRVLCNLPVRRHDCLEEWFISATTIRATVLLHPRAELLRVCPLVYGTQMYGYPSNDTCAWVPLHVWTSIYGYTSYLRSPRALYVARCSLPSLHA